MRVSQVLEFLFRGLQFLDEQKTHASSKGLWEGLAFYRNENIMLQLTPREGGEPR